jgi:2-phospho-L-lactate guanylyltransferase
VRWRVLIPVKTLEESKSRLAGATQSASRHPELVRALQFDTIAAVVAAAATDDTIAAIYLVADEPPSPLPIGVSVLADPGGGLNRALAGAAADIAAQHPQDGIAAMVADLPALRPEELLAALSDASAFDRAFVRDRSGTGTTTLTAGPGQPLNPLFGDGSANRHRDSGAVEVPAGPSLRADVDTAADLQQCLVLGVGEHTADLVAHLI